MEIVADGWRTHRIWMASICGAELAASRRILDFWPLGSVLKALFELALMLLLLPLAGFALGLVIAAGAALWRRQMRRSVSSFAAIIVAPVCFFLVARVSIFDPWFWEAFFNITRIEAIAASRSSSTEPKFAVIEIRDVSLGVTNHFVALVYDESDAVGRTPFERSNIWRTRSLWPAFSSIQIPKGTRLFGHFFRVDDFE